MENAPKLEIYGITPEDLDGIVAIENVSFPTPWPRRVFEREIKSQKSYNRVMRFSGMVVGYIVTWTIYDEVHILNIAVHPNFRNMGIGERLLRDCISHSADIGLRYAILEVRISNTRAISLYEKLGFKTIHTRRKYYSDTGEDAYVMMFEIKTS
ncbi:MAG: ribosomal protein S18-alanine N-acetyltransferase [Thermodesulfobacteriota bacterium]